MSTAAMIVIGDEILTGKVHDKNSHTLARLLFSRGVTLTRIEVIPDDHAIIAERVRHYSDTVDYVFTSGGIGPTHDDITYEGVAKAFGVEVEEHEPTLKRMKEYYERRAEEKGEPELELNADRRRMATFPVGADMVPIPPMWVPIVRFKNVHILPGIPELFQKMVVAFAPQLSGIPLTRFVVKTLLGEGEIATVLRDAAAAHPAIAIGSYPRYERRDLDEAQEPFKVRVTFEGADAEATEALAKEVAQKIEGSLVQEAEVFASQT